MSETHREKPLCLAVVVCERIITDEKSKNKSFIEVFTKIFSKAAPVLASRFAMCVSLTNIVGEVPIRIRIIGPNMEEVLNFEAKANSKDPNGLHDIAFNLPGIKLPVFGTYHINVLCGEELIGGRPFSLVQVPKGGKH